MKSLGIAILLTASMLLAQTKNKSEDMKTNNGESKAFTKLVDRYFDEYFRFNPTAGTSAGFHQYDTKLEDYSQKATAAQIAAFRRLRIEFERFDVSKASDMEKSDRDLVLANIKSNLLELEVIRQWEHNPDRYSSGISSSAFTIMARKFASPDARLKSLIEREKQMPLVLDVARANLKEVPRIYTEVALEQIPGIVSFFEKDIPEAFKEAQDEKLRQQFAQTNKAVIAALNSYGDWLKEGLLPRSSGDFRIGKGNYVNKLLYDEMVDVPLDKLLEIGMADLRRNQDHFRKVAAMIDPQKTPEQVLHQAEADHPAPDKLLQTFRDTLAGLQDFITKKHIVAIPSPVQPILEETPPFMRALTFASMDTPGPYEKVAKEAYFNVTLPEANWPKQQVEEHMAGFNRGTIISTAVHEAYPGHYVQFLWVQHAPSKVRKLIGCNSNAEGWAHYSEQMMLDEGYGSASGKEDLNDPQFLKLRLGQLQDALLRNARFIVGVEMHTGRMTFDEGVRFFEKEGFQSHAIALRESKRGTSDPTYLVYTMGKLQILKLRDDYKKLKGEQFSLEDFHNEIMKQGFPPLKIIRRAMLNNESPTL